MCGGFPFDWWTQPESAKPRTWWNGSVWNVPARHLKQADLVLLLFNYAEPLTEDDRKLLSVIQDTAIIMVNKTDLPRRIESG